MGAAGRAQAEEEAKAGEAGEAALQGERGAEALQLSDRAGGEGARVERVPAASLASPLLRARDIVVAADGRPIRSAKQLEAYLGSLPQGAAVLLEILRGGRTRLVGVQVTPPPPRKAPPPAPPPRAAAPAPQVIIVEVGAPQAGAAAALLPIAPPVIAVGGGFEPWPAPRPPAFSAPGLPQTPGATFAPAPGTSAYAYPQIPGVAQPPGFLVPLRGPGR